MAASHPSRVAITDDALIRLTTPSHIIAGLEADARRTLTANPERACTVACRWPTSGPRQKVVVLFTGYANPADNGLTAITFMGDPAAVGGAVKRTLLELLAGNDGRSEARGRRS